MAINLLSKLRNELYKVSEFYEIEDENEHEQNNESAIIELLHKVKSLRNKSEHEIIENFIPTLSCDVGIIIKAIFYIRDIRYGLGERRVFKVIVNYLALNMPNIIIDVLPYINKYGRWDDYYALFNTPLEKEVINIFKIQLNRDLTSRNPSNLAKWLKSENTSSKISRKLGTRTRILLGYTSQEYRVILSTLRKRLNVLEVKISSSNFNLIDYAELELPTILRYKESFLKNDKKRFENYLDEYKLNITNVREPFKLLNSNNSPFNIIDIIVKDKECGSIPLNKLYENIWAYSCKQYKELFEDTYVITCISAECRNNLQFAFKATISMILLFNKYNTNLYKDYYMYFDPKPRFGKVENISLISQIESLKNKEYLSPKNIECGLDLLLFTSIKKNLSNDEIPKNILIISDYDLESKYKNNNNFQMNKNKWGLSGYVMPKLKFWQIQEEYSVQTINRDIYSNIFARGYSIEVLKSILKGECSSSDELLLQKILGYRYSDIH